MGPKGQYGTVIMHGHSNYFPWGSSDDIQIIEMGDNEVRGKETAQDWMIYVSNQLI